MTTAPQKFRPVSARSLRRIAGSLLVTSLVATPIVWLGGAAQASSKTTTTTYKIPAGTVLNIGDQEQFLETCPHRLGCLEGRALQGQLRRVRQWPTRERRLRRSPDRRRLHGRPARRPRRSVGSSREGRRGDVADRSVGVSSREARHHLDLATQGSDRWLTRRAPPSRPSRCARSRPPDSVKRTSPR